jgi:lipopolysaccharide/colanic/teichoic acid biosynthesis glycosyltransferase
MQFDQLILTQKDLRSLQGVKSGLFLAAGFFAMFTLASFAAWGGFGFWRHAMAWPMLVLCAIAYLGTIAVLRQFQRLPRARIFSLVLLSVSLAFVVVIVVIALWRFYYSRSFLSVAYVVNIFLFLLAFEFKGQSHQLRLAVLPVGMAKDLQSVDGVDWVLLREPELPGKVDGIVVDWHAKLASQWVRFLSNCSLKRLPVYHAAVIFEAATGKVSLAHLSEGLVDEFRLSLYYKAVKRFMDLAVVLLCMPLVLPLCGLLALVIRLDSHGPALFWQERVGEGGRPFRICKFRSMHISPEKAGASFAMQGDQRITRIGRFLRASRLDELPQLWNVLKGEMSLIGPRPEQVPFVNKFDAEIAFYGYRHLVRPGITGWAQVHRGYTAGTSETRDKLEFDLYYIKYFSLWIDVLILLKTVRTILTGDGAR